MVVEISLQVLALSHFGCQARILPPRQMASRQGQGQGKASHWHLEPK